MDRLTHPSPECPHADVLVAALERIASLERDMAALYEQVYGPLPAPQTSHRTAGRHLHACRPSA